MRPSEDEINTEAEWIFDRLTTYTSLEIEQETGRVETVYKYSMLLRKKDAKAKIIKVLQMKIDAKISLYSGVHFQGVVPESPLNGYIVTTQAIEQL